MLLQDMEFRERYPHGLPAVDALPRLEDMPAPSELLPTLPSARQTLQHHHHDAGSSAAAPPVEATAAAATAPPAPAAARADGHVPDSLEAALLSSEASSAATAATAALAPAAAPADNDGFRMHAVPPVTAWPSDLVLGWDRSQAIVNQLAKDTALLACHGLMDYSLLVSVVPIADYAPPAYAAGASAAAAGDGSGAGAVEQAFADADGGAAGAGAFGEPVSWLLQPDHSAPPARDGTQAWRWMRLPSQAGQLSQRADGVHAAASATSSSGIPAGESAAAAGGPGGPAAAAPLATNALLSALGFSSFYGHSEEDEAAPMATAAASGPGSGSGSGFASGTHSAAAATPASAAGAATAAAGGAASGATGADSPSVLRITRPARAGSDTNASADAVPAAGAAADGMEGPGGRSSHLESHGHAHGHGHGHRDRTSSMLRLVPAVVESSSAVTPYAGLGADAAAAATTSGDAAAADSADAAQGTGTAEDKAGNGDDGNDDSDDDDVAISFRLSLNKAPSLSFADCLHLVHAASSLPRQIASFGRPPRHFVVPAGFDASLALPPIYGHGANSNGGRVTRWSPLAVSVCALGTPRAAPQPILSPAGDSSGAALSATAAGSPAPATVVRLRSPMTFSGRALVQIGVVDMLQAYDVGKKVEFTFKTLRHAVAHASLAAADISSVDPVAYAARFNAFVGHIFTPAPGGFAFWRDPSDIASIAVSTGSSGGAAQAAAHGGGSSAAAATTTGSHGSTS